MISIIEDRTGQGGQISASTVLALHSSKWDVRQTCSHPYLGYGQE
jgi:hypothetical protein